VKSVLYGAFKSLNIRLVTNSSRTALHLLHTAHTTLLYGDPGYIPDVLHYSPQLIPPPMGTAQCAYID